MNATKLGKTKTAVNDLLAVYQSYQKLLQKEDIVVFLGPEGAKVYDLIHYQKMDQSTPEYALREVHMSTLRRLEDTQFRDCIVKLNVDLMNKGKTRGLPIYAQNNVMYGEVLEDSKVTYSNSYLHKEQESDGYRLYGEDSHIKRYNQALQDVFFCASTRLWSKLKKTEVIDASFFEKVDSKHFTFDLTDMDGKKQYKEVYVGSDRTDLNGIYLKEVGNYKDHHSLTLYSKVFIDTSYKVVGMDCYSMNRFHNFSKPAEMNQTEDHDGLENYCLLLGDRGHCYHMVKRIQSDTVLSKKQMERMRLHGLVEFATKEDEIDYLTDCWRNDSKEPSLVKTKK